MSDWKEISLGNCIDVKHGFAFKGEFFQTESNNNILTTPGNFKIGGGWKEDKCKYFNGDIPQDYILGGGELVVTMTDLSKEVDTLGYSAIIPKSEKKTYLHNQRIGLVEFINDEIDKYYLYWLMRDKEYRWHIVSSASGSTVSHTSPTRIKEYEFLLPPLPEQKAIASLLSSLDDKIDLLHSQNKTLEAIAETLFRQWFVEEAKDDWEEGILEDILSVKGGTTPSTKVSEYWDGEIHWTAPRDLSTSHYLYLFNTSRKITKKGLAKISSGLLPIGTILLSSRAPIGYLAITAIPLAINQGYIAIIDDKGFSKYYLYLWVKSNLDYIISNANGSVFLEISKSVFKSLEILKPPPDLRERFDGQVIPLFKKSKQNEIQIRTLEKLRNTLLPKLMSGKVRVEYES